MQFFSRESLDLSRRISDKLIFVMQDIISLRTNYLSSNELIDIFRDSIINSDKIIAISKFVREDMKGYFNDLLPSVEVIHHGLLDKRTSHKDEQYILVVGNKFHHKSIKECIYIIKDSNYKFKVIGLDIEIIQSDNIEYIKSGHLKEIEIEQLYQNCSLILYPSSYEGFGLPICHAIRFSKYIICFENQLNCELVEYFQFFKGIKLITSFEEIENTISELSNIEIPDYTVPEEFTWENTSRKYIKVFKDMLI
jgi:glycosyltransferase involved in cell wall biosynthesis